MWERADRSLKPAGVAALAVYCLAGRAVAQSGDDVSFLPHGYCYQWDRHVVLLHVISDGLITLSYFCIPVALIYLVKKRGDLPFNWIFFMFAGFIVSCGITHFMEIWTIWHATYVLSGVLKAATAVLSVMTAVMMVPLIPKALAIPSSEQLRVTNQELQLAVLEREMTAQQLRHTLREREVVLVELAGGHADAMTRQATELAHSRQALETQTAMLQSVLDNMAEGLVATDQEGNFIIWNKAAETILGYGLKNLPAQEWSKYYGTYHSDEVTPFPTEDLPLVRAIRGEESFAQMFVRNAKVVKGTWIECSGSPLKDREGAVHGGMVAFRDISQRKTDEQKIRELTDSLESKVAERTAQLEVAIKELESFSYSVSHDLRAPLRHIIGFSKMLQEEFGSTLDPGASRYLDRIQAGTQRMGLLVDELLSLARVGRHALNRQAVPLKAVVEEVLAMLEPEAAGREVEWAIDELPEVNCDPVLVKQVFQNLLANALKFTRPNPIRESGRQQEEAGGKLMPHAIIHVRCREENGQPVFAVQDNGIGFSMKYVDKLFGVFQRLHRAEEFEGAGIGLATVQRIVHKHGGRVWAEGELGKGATFSFTLSAARPMEARNSAASAGGQS